MVPQIFRELKVIELAGVLAGPSVGYFFAELGAQVIKIENPETNGDVTRSWKLKSEDAASDASAYYWSVNALKQSLFLNLKHALSLQKLHEMVKDADILITNYKAGDDKKLNVDYETLSAINPKLIYASINGFGPESPRGALDLILQAESGFMSMNGESGAAPLKMPVALIDLLAAHQLKEAVLIALLERYKTGKGCAVSVSLFDSAVASLANQATNWLIGGEVPKQSGSLHPNIAPYGEIFETKDAQQVTFAIGSNKQFAALCEVLQNTSLCRERNFSNNQLRIRNRQQLYSLLYDCVKRFPFTELYERCLERQVPVGKIRNLKEVFELPEAKEMILRFQNNKKELKTVSGIAFKFHGDKQR